LLSARETGQVVPGPLSSHPDFDLNTAYKVEAALRRLREAGGHSAVGRKVGYANKAMWRVLKLETLVWAHMYDDTVHNSDSNSATLMLAHSRSLKIEPEIVFGLKQPITAEALESTDWLAIGFEIIDCPFPGWQFQASDFVACFGLHAGLVIGEKMHVQSNLMGKLVDELAQFKVRIFKNGEFVEEGSGRNCLRSPALCLAELSTAMLRRFPGQPLNAGEIISSGTLTAGHQTDRGASWRVEVEGLALPSLTLHLT
jgi:2-oxo-3-hexenedioate decarboxylase